MAHPTTRRRGLPALAAALLALSACGTTDAEPSLDLGAAPAEAADADADVSKRSTGVATFPRSASTTTTTRPPAASTTALALPVAHGTPETPFAPLPQADEPRAIVSPSGVVLPVVSETAADDNGRSWIALTPCGTVEVVSSGRLLGRAHIVIDPGHGGREFGAVGGGDTIEKDVNLAVAQAAEAMLIEAGATVVLTRSTDISMTTGVRAAIARSVDPALFVSIHHNGGAPATGDRPGTIVFTKFDHSDSNRFGGLFHEALTPKLVEAARIEQEKFQVYAEAFTAHEALTAAYDQSVAARDAALVANGQIDPTATTLAPERPAGGVPTIDGNEEPSVRAPITTTTVPVAADGRVAVPVPDTLPMPTPFELERVPQFRWAGSGNAGVRAWVGHDGRDVLSVLRRSGDVPAALVEYLYVTNPVEEALLADPAFIEAEAAALVEAIVAYLSTDAHGTGFIATQVGTEDIGGGGRPSDCIDPDLGY